MTATPTLFGRSADPGDPEGNENVATDSAPTQELPPAPAASPMSTTVEIYRPAATPEAYRPIAQPATDSERLPFSRKFKRVTETQEIKVRTTHKRRKVFARGGVLASFALAMVVYPIMGNVVQYADSAEAVPGVVLGETPTTGHALLGDGPALVPTVMEVPSVDDEAHALAVSDTTYTVSTNLPDCVVPAEFTGENGKLSADQLCTLWDGTSKMRADAALAVAELNEQFKAKFGRDICIYQGYRSYAEQVATKASRGYLAATPGTSMHGYGLAFDLCGGDDTGAPKAWLDANAAAFGFVNPEWAKWRKYEPWHWEYKPGIEALGVFTDSYWTSGGVSDGTSASDIASSTDTGPTASDETTAAATGSATATEEAVEETVDTTTDETAGE